MTEPPAWGFGCEELVRSAAPCQREGEARVQGMPGVLLQSI